MLFQRVFLHQKYAWYITWYCLSWNTLSLVAVFSSVLVMGDRGGGEWNREQWTCEYKILYDVTCRLFVCQFESDQSASGLPTTFTWLVKFYCTIRLRNSPKFGIREIEMWRKHRRTTNQTAAQGQELKQLFNMNVLGNRLLSSLHWN